MMRDVSCQCFIEASRTIWTMRVTTPPARRSSGLWQKNIAISTPLAPPMHVPRTGVGGETYADLFTGAGHRRRSAQFRAHGAGCRFGADVIRPAGIDRAGDPCFGALGSREGRARRDVCRRRGNASHHTNRLEWASGDCRSFRRPRHHSSLRRR